MLSDQVTAAVALQYGLENSVEGPWHSPQFGAVPQTTVKSTLSTLTVIFGVRVTL